MVKIDVKEITTVFYNFVDQCHIFEEISSMRNIVPCHLTSLSEASSLATDPEKNILLCATDQNGLLSSTVFVNTCLSKISI